MNMGAAAIVMPFRRRKLLFFYKFLALVSNILLIAVILLPYFRKSCSENKSKKVNHLSKVNLEILKEREKAIRENRDEFLEEVLTDTSYFEIDLHSRGKPGLPYSVYDKRIVDMETKIKNYSEIINRTEVPKELIVEARRVFEKEAFNRILSEMLPLNRPIPETREHGCRDIEYKVESLPTLSVIIIYSDEALISILRTIHSVFNRTPETLLKEVILVDDFSTKLDLQQNLERYLATRIKHREKIRLLKLSRRSGLIRTRMVGAHVATGEVLAFLDAHCEVNQKWAEPLLARILENDKVAASPVIDNIDQQTMEYSRDDSGSFYVGGFKWEGQFFWRNVPEYEKERKNFNYDPTQTPIIAGGLFAINRKYFWNIGSYDPGMVIWGGENLEISLRIWMCGGSVEIIPCSRVGHIFRDFRPYTFAKIPGVDNEVGWNTARVANVWMDEFKELYYLHNPDMWNKSFGNVEGRRKWRERKECKSFKWYLAKVYRDKFKSKWDSVMWGQLRNPGTDLCLDNLQNGEDGEYKLGLFPCYDDQLPASQLFFLSKKQELRRERGCAGVVEGGGGKEVKIKECEDEEKMQGWVWREQQNGRMVNQETEMCLTVKRKDGGTGAWVGVETCRDWEEENAEDQRWQWRNFEEENE